MPPRKRNTGTSTPEAQSSLESSDSSETGETAAAASRRKKREALSGKDAVILSDFVVSEAGEAPGKQYSEPRDNPFDKPLTDSYQSRLEDDDKYLKFTTNTDAVEAQARLIRASAAYLKIGSKVRVQDNGDGTATVYFRGQARRTKPSRTTSTPDDTDDHGDHEQENVPAA